MNDQDSRNNRFGESANGSDPGKGKGMLSAVFKDVVKRLSEIIRSEIRLAKAEAAEDVRKGVKIGTYYLAGTAFAFFAVGFVLLAGVYALSTVLVPWLAAVIVALLSGIVASALFAVGREKLKTTSLRLDQTIRTMEDNVRWIKQPPK